MLVSLEMKSLNRLLITLHTISLHMICIKHVTMHMKDQLYYKLKNKTVGIYKLKIFQNFTSKGP
jgi:hypothetical protein